jgi:uncharacterized membrane protein YkvA (DUF1232 family)
LAYFILPADVVPDMIPGVGFVDDLSTLAAALATVRLSITDEIQQKAQARSRWWFGSGS